MTRAARGTVRRWGAALGALAAATAVMLALREHLDKAHVALGYLLVVLGVSARAGRVIGLAVATAAFLAFNFLFLPPYYTLVIANPLDWLVAITFFVTSIVAAQLLYRAQATAEAATARATEVDRLATLGAETLGAPGAGEALRAIATVIRSALGVDTCEVYVRDAAGRLSRAAGASEEDAANAPAVPSDSLVRRVTDGGRSAVELSDGTVRLATTADAPRSLQPLGGPWRVVEAAGWQAAALQYAVGVSDDGRGPVRARLRRLVRGDAAPPLDVRAVLLPLVVRDHTVGVLRVASMSRLRLTPEQARLLVALAYYAALGVERVRLVESAERAEAERRLEQLRSALLMSVSHDLRTPLTTIKGIAHEVARGAPAARAAVIEEEADRLDALVGDLLDLSRIQAGAVRSQSAVNTVDELVGAALQRAAGALGARPVRVELPSDTMLAGWFDFTQTLRVVVNLLENAAKYAPPGAPVDVSAGRVGDRLTLAVMDRGPGVPNEEAERIFEPFYRPPGTPPDVRGTGLGLSIARGLVEAQGGRLRYAGRPGGGSVFTVELPAADVPESR